LRHRSSRKAWRTRIVSLHTASWPQPFSCAHPAIASMMQTLSLEVHFQCSLMHTSRDIPLLSLNKSLGCSQLAAALPVWRPPVVLFMLHRKALKGVQDRVLHDQRFTCRRSFDTDRSLLLLRRTPKSSPLASTLEVNFAQDARPYCDASLLGYCAGCT